MAGKVRSEARPTPRAISGYKELLRKEFPGMHVRIVIEGEPGWEEAVSRCLSLGLAEKKLTDEQKVILTRSIKGRIFLQPVEDFEHDMRQESDWANRFNKKGDTPEIDEVGSV